MRRALLVAIPVLLLALSASGQVLHGTPASVTSIGGNGTFIGGVPASVTSITPRLPFGIAPPNLGRGMSPGFNHPGFNRPGGSFGRHPHGPRFGGSLPLIIPYPVYTNYDAYGYEAYGAQAGQQPLQIEIRVVQDGKDQNQTDQYAPGDQIPGESDSEGESRLTMRNDRGQPRQESTSKSAQPSEPAQAAEPAPAREVVPTVLIFRDGHRQEVRNYAIMGKVLYDLEDSRKIQLAELDIPATVKENDERGVRFAMPRE